MNRRTVQEKNKSSRHVINQVEQKKTHNLDVENKRKKYSTKKFC